MCVWGIRAVRDHFCIRLVVFCLNPTCCCVEVRLHNTLRDWLTCCGVVSLDFPGSADPCSSNCRSVITLWLKGSAEKRKVESGSILSYCDVLVFHTCFWRCSWLSSEQQQHRHRLGLHQPGTTGPHGHGNSFCAVHFLHGCRPTPLNTVQVWLHRLIQGRKNPLDELSSSLILDII